MRLFGSLLTVLLLALPAPAAAQATSRPRGRSVVIYTATAQDGRVDAARQAADFWNRTLAGLHAPPAFQAPRVTVSPREVRRLQTYATRISKDGWKDDAEYGPGSPALEPPPEVSDLAGDVIVLLSTQPILPFSWPLGAGRYLVTIRTDTVPPLDTGRAQRNVIAHELGHTLGLTHHGAQNLMCASCDMNVASYLPLTSEDLARLSVLKE